MNHNDFNDERTLSRACRSGVPFSLNPGGEEKEVKAPGRREQFSMRAMFFIGGFATAAWAALVPFAKVNSAINDATLGYAGVLAGPASIGFIAHHSGLPNAFIVVGGLLIVVAGVLRTVKL